MSSAGTVLLLGARAVRRRGIGLLAAGLLLPWLILAWRAAEPPLPEDLRGPVTLRPELVALPAGSFQMGSPPEETGHEDDERLHEVRIPRPFLIALTEVTQGQLAAVLGEGVLHRGDDSGGRSCREAGVGPDLPAVCVTWHEAVAFCNRLSELEGLEPAYVIRGEEVTWPKEEADGYRLPTEGEWEYAARAGTRTVWVGTDEASWACRHGNVADESAKAENPDWETFPCDDRYPRLAPVGAKEVNGWHLHGLGGNAAEWVWDWYGVYPAGDGAADDPRGPDGGSDRGIRGGSWRGGPRDARVAYRFWDAPGDRNVGLGFRLARSCPSASLPSDCLPPP